MPGRYENFVHRENIRNFEKKLQTEKDVGRRDLLLTLLAEEKLRLTATITETHGFDNRSKAN